MTPRITRAGKLYRRPRDAGAPPAARLGAEVSLIGLVGDDPLADILLAAAAADDIDTRYVRRDPTKATGIAVPVVMPSGENSILAAPRANLEMSESDVQGSRPFPAFGVQVVDSVGAGDAFCGALAVALAEGFETMRAIRFASASAALSLTGAGAITSLPRRREVEAFLAARG